MENAQEIIVEADVHEHSPGVTGTRQSTRTGAKGTSAPPPAKKTPKKRGPKPKDTDNGTSKRMTINSLAIIVSDNDKAQNARVDILEREIRSTNSVLKGLGDTLKELVSAMPSINNPSVQAVSNIQQAPTPPAPVPAAPATNDVAGQRAQHVNSGHMHPAPSQALTPAPQHAALPPPQTLVREENRNGALDNMISQEDYKSGSNHGKHMSFNELGMAKPYMFLYREGLQTPRQKLDIRASLSTIEYINCTLLLIQDPDAFKAQDLPHILAHLTAVSTDAMVRPWSAVRAWSQYVWDCIEKGKCNWNSYQFIQDERVRMSFISGAPSGNIASGVSHNKSSNHDLKVLLCRDYNSISGCRHHGTHEDQGVKLLHACSHCDAMGRRSSHSYMRCRSKLDTAPYPGQSTHDNRHWHQSNSRQHYSGHTGDAQQGQPGGYRNGSNHQGNGGPKNA